MLRRVSFLLLYGLLCYGTCIANGAALTPSEQSHMEVSLRMVGHQVLLSAGNRSSVVLPIDKRGKQYRVRFEAPFAFEPEAVGLKIDSVIGATRLSANYIVEFVDCDSHRVVHSYEIGAQNDVMACQGRSQPEACYELWITFLDLGSHPSGSIFQSGSSGAGGEGGTKSFLLAVLAVAAVTAITVYLFMRNTKPKLDSNEIRIGAFKFNKQTMELSIHDDRIELTGKEADLLQLLSESANATIEREDILNAVWGDDGDYVGRTLDVFISKLRKKLEADANVRIVNIRGIGYKLVLADA
ncbi:MAG: winged helix-turn-helix domain-containing protein [Cryomorphaceae bacterium]